MSSWKWGIVALVVVVAVVAAVGALYLSMSAHPSPAPSSTYAPPASTTSMAPMPELIPVASASVNINSSAGGTVRLGNIIAVIRPGTNATFNGQNLTSYAFSIIDYEVVGVGLPSAPAGSAGTYAAEPIYAYAYAVDGQVSPQYTFTQPIITVVRMPNGWTSWTWLGYTQEPNGTLVGGSYKFPDSYAYAGSGLFVNYQFIKPVPWIFISGAQLSRDQASYAPQIPVNPSLMTSTSPELIPVGSATVEVNASQGAAVALGNLLAVVTPGTYVEAGGQVMPQYNFSLVYQAVHDVPPPNAGTAGWPLFSYAFAVDGNISPAYTFVNSEGKPTQVVTIAFLPPNFRTWTWLGYTQEPNGVLVGGSYKFPDVWIPGDDYTVNVQFFKPVPWIFLGGETNITGQAVAPNTTATSGYAWGG